MSRAGNRRRSAHTLLEMVVALAVIGVVLGAVAPALTVRREPDGAARAAWELTRLLRRARATAVERGAAVTVVLDPARARVWVAIERAGGAAPLAEDSLAAETGVVLEAATPRVTYTFAPTGEAFGPPVLARDAARSLLVLVDPWTGAPHAASR